MVDIQRRTFLKKMGLCTILLTAGNIREGIAYITSGFNHPGLTQPSSVVDQICFVGVGALGLRTSRPLAKGLYRVPYSPSSNDRNSFVENSIGILEFDPCRQGVYSFVENKDLIFLIGSFADRDFWIARDLILSANPKLLVNIIPSSFEPTVSKPILTPRANESFLFADNKSFIPSAIYVVRDICSILFLRNLICIDFIDVRNVMSGSFARAFCIESAMDASIEQYKSLVFENKHYLNQADTLLTIISYDHKAPSTMEHVQMFGDQLLNCIKQEPEEILFAMNIDQILSTDLRATLLAAIKRG